MVEYFMLVLEGFGVDNCWIEIEGGNEVFLLDGLVCEWVEVIEELGLLIVINFFGVLSVRSFFVVDVLIFVFYGDFFVVVFFFLFMCFIYGIDFL